MAAKVVEMGSSAIHTVAVDSEGRIIVSDGRTYHRMQVFQWRAAPLLSLLHAVNWTGATSAAVRASCCNAGRINARVCFKTEQPQDVETASCARDCSPLQLHAE